ncbi:head GIN domain-containing protein [Urechidicola croceus]|uniref:Putative auto-transporter adhesin head GIN domain-containing protein n=1 Tax=Urechidicola croceus TaxID=1850246 RepID=A0A1D8P3W1_9FLAO|nr:head GIN domain-containing protein [Urechidicola croceus]AOW19211.1 hypothetical protein LPB138_00260 [Urechidicola croceus]
MKTLKTIVTLLAICISVQVNAFTKKVKGNGNVVTIERTTTDYQKIAVGGFFNVTLVAGNEGNLTIEIEENLKDYLITEVKDGKLKINWKKGINVQTRKGVKITVPFEDIEGVALAGSGEIKNTSTINTSNLELKIAGSGDLKLDVNTEQITSKIAGSGNMKIYGSTNDLECKIAGSGDFEGYDLIVNNAMAQIAGSGTIKATVNGTLSAKISGSGDFYYKGNPKTENIKVSGSGSVTKR